jgi:pimeloyl-ACP methyl ester carboxylesterase
MGTDTMPLALREFMDALHIDKATLVGHSWGGGWVLAYALAYPERVDRIVLINSSGLDVPDVFEWELLKMPLVGSLLLRFLTLNMIKTRLELSFFKKGIVDDAMALEVHLPMMIPENRKAQHYLPAIFPGPMLRGIWVRSSIKPFSSGVSKTGIWM